MSSENRPMFDIQAAVYSDRLHYEMAPLTQLLLCSSGIGNVHLWGLPPFFILFFFQCNLFKEALKHFSN